MEHRDLQIQIFHLGHYRSSRPKVFRKKVYLEISQNSTTFVTEHLCWLLLSLNDKGISMSLNHIASLIKFISDIKLMLRCAKTIYPYCTCEKFLNYT